jgi:hypothetical protein
MSALVEFLNARLDEDEAIANAPQCKAWELQPYWHHPNGESPIEGNVIATDVDPSARFRRYITGPEEHDIDDARHIASHDPARVLREIAGKRGVVREMEAARTSLEDRGVNVPFFITWTLMYLAAVYNDHPDYRKDWAID